MNPAKWSRVRSLFEQALLLFAAERQSLLAGSGDAELAAEVESLLRVYDESPDFLEGDSPALPDDGETAPEHSALAGRRVGPWLLVREIGRGGMGLVWEAERADREYEFRAAIKLLPSGAFSAVDVARFRDERQILARLNHPGIARLLDGGTADDGSPYLVMEYIEGEPLDSWCAGRKLSLRDRVKLFLPICEAVDYAHRHLVIHRDIKPGNILVTPDGRPKLLDFGIAKLLDSGAVFSRGGTGTLHRFLTPQYASPEQIRGEISTTATDIYSLGVTLFLVLTGHPPYPWGTNDPLQMMLAICEQDVRPPSAFADGPEELRGELDAIVLQCLRKVPEQRYPSAAALAADLSRWLDGKPVSAHAVSRVRVALKFMRRNKVQSIAAAVTLFAVLSGAAVSLGYARFAERERARAEARFNLVRQIAHAVIFDIHDAIQDLPGATRARRILIDQALRYLKELQATGGRTPELDLEIAAAYLKIGSVLANVNTGYLGNVEMANDSEQRARALALEVLRSNPANLNALSILAGSNGHLSRIMDWQGDSRAAKEFGGESRDGFWSLAARQPQVPGWKAKALASKMELLAMDQDWAGVVAAHSEALRAYQDAIAQTSDSNFERLLLYLYQELERAYKELGNSEMALELCRRGARLGADLVTRYPALVWPRMEYSFAILEAGWLEHTLGKHRESIAHYAEALAIQRQLADADPQDYWSRIEYAKLLNTAASAYEADGRRKEAIRMLKEAARELEAAWKHDPGNEDTRGHIGWVWSNLGDLYLRAGQPDQTVLCYRRAMETLRSPGAEASPTAVGSLSANLRHHLQAQLALAGCGKPMERVRIPGTF